MNLCDTENDSGRRPTGHRWNEAVGSYYRSCSFTMEHFRLPHNNSRLCFFGKNTLLFSSDSYMFKRDWYNLSCRGNLPTTVEIYLIGRRGLVIYYCLYPEDWEGNVFYRLCLSYDQKPELLPKNLSDTSLGLRDRIFLKGKHVLCGLVLIEVEPLRWGYLRWSKLLSGHRISVD